MNIIRPISLGFSLIVLLASQAAASITIQAQENSEPVEKIRYAVAQISSNDEFERRAAWNTLLGAGDTAIPPLLALVDSLTPKVEVCPPGSNLPCKMVLIVQSDSQRLTWERAISLLGELRATAAVPRLIKSLCLEESIAVGFRQSGPEKKALIMIGEGAVPELLDSLGFAVDRRRKAEATYGRKPSYSESEMRIIDVLGEIGDRRALPVLEELKKNAGVVLEGSLDEAIERITKKVQQ